jgi:Na+-driven multidrug efflux pump
VVFVLDGVLIGAGDQDYLALAGLAATAVCAVAATVVVTEHAGLLGLWLAFTVWMLARFGTLTLRARGSRWLATGPYGLKAVVTGEVAEIVVIRSGE